MDIFQSHVKNNVFHVENTFDPWAICVQCNILHDTTTVAMLPNTTVVIWVTIMSALSHTVGYCLYGTLLLRPRWTACPVQIRAHHHIDVYIDINNLIGKSERNLKYVDHTCDS